MRKLIAAVICVGLVLAGSAAMAGNGKGTAKLPKITGGGITENNNSGFPVDLLGIGGFVAQATGEAVDAQHPVFPTTVTTYSARGQLQAKSVLASDPSTTLGSIHGEVVCIANMGPSSGVDGGGNPANDVWEIRFLVTNSSDPAFEGRYGSILIQDNGKEDYADENFALTNALNPNCGNVTLFELEPQIAGEIKVH